MYKIKVPASSANIGVGFDVLGIAFDLYNEFYFEKSDHFSFEGFENEYMNEDNLVKKTYISLFRYSNVDLIPVKIGIKSVEIPISRGLGSSTSLVIAGAFAANYYMGNIYTKDQLYSICSNIEGHPDNVGPAIYGGFVAGYQLNEEFFHISYPLNAELKFLVIIPDQKIATQLSRSVLPIRLLYSDIVNNTSRIINLPYAFEKGDMELLRVLLMDKMHEPYRLPLIFKAYEVKNIAIANDSVCVLSGSGSTLLVITKKSDLKQKFDSIGYPVLEVTVSKGIIEGENI